MQAVARFEFDAREHYRALRAAWKFNPARFVIPLFGVVLPATMIWVFVAREWDRISLQYALVNGLPWLGVSALYLSVPTFAFWVKARMALANDPSLRGPQVRQVDERALEVGGSGFSQRLGWPDISRTIETPEFFFFFYSRFSAYYIPKRSLDAAGIATLRQIIASPKS